MKLSQKPVRQVLVVLTVAAGFLVFLGDKMKHTESELEIEIDKKKLLSQSEMTKVILTLQQQRNDLLKALKKGAAPNSFAIFANFAEDCMTKPSMAIYKGQFTGLATFLRSCVDRSEKTLQAIAKAESEIK